MADPTQLAQLMASALPAPGAGNWMKAMERAIEAGHLAAWLTGSAERLNVSVGSKLLNKKNLSKAERAEIKAAIARQRPFLEKFNADRANLTPGQIAVRMELYAQAVKGTYYAARWGDWQLPYVPGDGSSECLGRCLCSASVKDNGDGTGIYTWQLGSGASENHCATCPTRAGDHLVMRKGASTKTHWPMLRALAVSAKHMPGGHDQRSHGRSTGRRQAFRGGYGAARAAGMSVAEARAIGKQAGALYAANAKAYAAMKASDAAEAKYGADHPLTKKANAAYDKALAKATKLAGETHPIAAAAAHAQPHELPKAKAAANAVAKQAGKDAYDKALANGKTKAEANAIAAETAHLVKLDHAEAAATADVKQAKDAFTAANADVFKAKAALGTDPTPENQAAVDAAQAKLEAAAVEFNQAQAKLDTVSAEYTQALGKASTTAQIEAEHALTKEMQAKNQAKTPDTTPAPEPTPAAPAPKTPKEVAAELATPVYASNDAKAVGKQAAEAALANGLTPDQAQEVLYQTTDLVDTHELLGMYQNDLYKLEQLPPGNLAANKIKNKEMQIATHQDSLQKQYDAASPEAQAAYEKYAKEKGMPSLKPATTAAPTTPEPQPTPANAPGPKPSTKPSKSTTVLAPNAQAVKEEAMQLALADGLTPAQAKSIGNKAAFLHDAKSAYIHTLDDPNSTHAEQQAAFAKYKALLDKAPGAAVSASINHGSDTPEALADAKAATAANKAGKAPKAPKAPKAADAQSTSTPDATTAQSATPLVHGAYESVPPNAAAAGKTAYDKAVASGKSADQATADQQQAEALHLAYSEYKAAQYEMQTGGAGPTGQAKFDTAKAKLDALTAGASQDVQDAAKAHKYDPIQSLEGSKPAKPLPVAPSVPGQLTTGTPPNQATITKDMQAVNKLLPLTTDGGVVKHTLVSNLAEKSGLPYDGVNKSIAKWAFTSNDSDYSAMKMQEAATLAFPGVQLSKWQKTKLANVEKQSSYDKVTPFDIAHGTVSPAVAKLGLTSAQDAQVHMLKTMHAETQKDLAAAGITHVTLKRGFALTEAEAKKRGFLPTAVGKDVVTSGNAMESWSSNSGIAETFAKAKSTGQEGPVKIVISMTVPADRVVGNAKTGFGCLSEHEWVLLGGVDDTVHVEMVVHESGKTTW